MKTDEQLKTDATEQLMWEPTVSSNDITIAAHNGVVTLIGTVPRNAR